MFKGPLIKKRKAITVKKKLDKVASSPRKAITVKTGEKQGDVALLEQKKRLELDYSLKQRRAIVEEETKRKTSHDFQFKPGESGNPNGRPMGRKNLTTMVREALQNIDHDGVRLEDKFVQNIVKLALRGNLKITELLWAYFDGRPNQPMTVTPDAGELSGEEQAHLDHLVEKNK